MSDPTVVSRAFSRWRHAPRHALCLAAAGLLPPPRARHSVHLLATLIALCAATASSAIAAPANAARQATAQRQARATAEGSANASEGSVIAATAPGSRVSEIPFTGLGVDYALRLRGKNGIVGIPFSVRTDELVSSASLVLR